MSKELLVIENVELVPFFTKGDQLDETLNKIAEELRAHVPDVSTDKGRKAIKANVTKGTKSKTFLEAHGKELAAEYKAIPKAIDANRKKAKGFLTAVIEEIRAPLTAWEAEQKAIEAAELAKKEAEIIKAKIDAKHEIAIFMDADITRERIEEAARVEQARIDREELIKKQAAEDARIEAEQKAAKELERIESEKQDAIDREIQAKVNEAKAKQDLIDAAYEALQSEKRRIVAENKAKQDVIDAKESARIAQIKQQKDREDAEAQARKEREADKEHRGKVNRQIIKDFMIMGLDEDSAVLAMKAVASGRINKVGISY